MGTALQQTDYQCEQCGATNIVAAPVVYSQGTHSFSGRFCAGTNAIILQRSSAAPPRPRGYLRPLLLWGSPHFFPSFWELCWASDQDSAIIRTTSGTQGLRRLRFSYLLDLAASLEWCFMSFRKVARYNREVYPRLYWDWEHTYVCKTMRRSQMIPS